MKILVYCWIIALTVPLLGQTAKVVALSSEETSQAKQLKADQESLIKRTQEFELAIKHKYLLANPKTPPSNYITCFNNVCDSNWKPGWGNNGDFEYSEDYRFIVPKPSTSSPNSTSITSWWNSNCYVTTPAYNGWYATPTSSGVIY